MSEAKPFDAQFTFVDFETGEHLRSISVQYPSPDNLPEPFFPPPSFSSFGGEGINFRFLGVSVPGITYDYIFSADGYETQRVSVATGIHKETIRLKKRSDRMVGD